MVWVGVTEYDRENAALEQILILRVQSRRRYYFSHVLFLSVLCAFAGSSLGGMAHPGLSGNRKTAVIFLWIKC